MVAHKMLVLQALCMMLFHEALLLITIICQQFQIHSSWSSRTSLFGPIFMFGIMLRLLFPCFGAVFRCECLEWLIFFPFFSPLSLLYLLSQSHSLLIKAYFVTFQKTVNSHDCLMGKIHLKLPVYLPLKSYACVKLHAYFVLK